MIKSKQRTKERCKSMKRKILIVDDDIDLAMITSDMLTDYGYVTVIAKDGEEAYCFLEKEKYDLILLDINLPREDGFEICKELRNVSTLPIIFASARTSEDDRVVGLDLGGDDYIEKPYSLKELLSRVNALIRRTYGFGQEEKIIEIGNIEINVTKRSVKKESQAVNLSLKEFDLLAYMAENKNKVLSKEQMLREVWGMYSEVEISTVAVHIRWLREKLEKEPSNPAYLKTVWGIGYCLCDEEKNN